MSTAQLPVLIVGAGLGGLALAQALRAKNIPFEIFERDDSAHSRSQGWAVALVDCLPGLAEYMPKDLGDLEQVSVSYGSGLQDTMTIIDTLTGETKITFGGSKPGTAGHLLRASRSKTRDYLWQHLTVQTGKAFDRYEQDRDGVTVYFKNGTSARGSVLVGADGAHSRIRKQLLGDTQSLTLSDWIPITGETTLPRHVAEQYFERAVAGIIGQEFRKRFVIGLTDLSADKETVKFYFIYSFRSDDPTADSAWVAAASPRTLYRRLLEDTKHYPNWLTEAIRRGGEDSIVTPGHQFLEYLPPSTHTLPRGRVTLLGDAAHTMVPFQGAGANNAIVDAIELTPLLIDFYRDTAGSEAAATAAALDWALQQYEGAMLERGRSAVLSSRAAGEATGTSAAAEETVKGRVGMINGQQVMASPSS